jgi:LPXTG-site transpeptidase (sortase) family protein
MHSSPRKRRITEILQASRFSKAFKEVGLFLGIFVSVFVISIVFVNAGLFINTIKWAFSSVKAESYVFSSDVSGSIDMFWSTEDQSDILKSVAKDRIPYVSSQQKIEASLQQKKYDFSYSLLPPGNRLYIPAIGVDAPIVDIDVTSEAKLKHWDFNTELFSGVVKYPSTPEPWYKGNTLIFGHTSYYRWKKNPFGEVFAKIYELKVHDEIKIAWKWQLYTYEIIDTMIVTPDKVDAAYMKYTNGEYITLMWCYPVGSDSRRGLIIAKRKPTAQNNMILLPH